MSATDLVIDVAGVRRKRPTVAARFGLECVIFMGETDIEVTEGLVEGQTIVTGAAELRVKESDRIAVVKTRLVALDTAENLEHSMFGRRTQIRLPPWNSSGEWITRCPAALRPSIRKAIRGR